MNDNPEGAADGAADDGTKGTTTMAFRLPHALAAQVRAVSDQAGITPSRFIHDVIEASFKNGTVVLTPPPPIPPKMESLSDEVHRLFASVSNNFNQLTKRVHFDHLNGLVSDKTYATVNTQLGILIRVLEARLPP